MAITFLKKGAAAHKEIAKADARDEATKEDMASGNVYKHRYWMPNDAEQSITFLDGDLTEDGMLDIAQYYEHNLQINGSWKNWFICTQDKEDCPLCEDGGKPALVAVFTVIDHNKWKDRNGKEYVNQKRLFVCKRDTLKRLQKLAMKRDGLAGCTFDVSRTGDKSPGVGSDFDFSEKNTLKKVGKIYKLEETPEPYDYGEVLPYKDAKALMALGFGSSSPQDSVGAGNGPNDDINLDDEL